MKGSFGLSLASSFLRVTLKSKKLRTPKTQISGTRKSMDQRKEQLEDIITWKDSQPKESKENIESHTHYMMTSKKSEHRIK